MLQSAPKEARRLFASIPAHCSDGAGGGAAAVVEANLSCTRVIITIVNINPHSSSVSFIELGR